jgi:hypothetical protein
MKSEARRVYKQEILGGPGHRNINIFRLFHTRREGEGATKSKEHKEDEEKGKTHMKCNGKTFMCLLFYVWQWKCT